MLYAIPKGCWDLEKPTGRQWAGIRKEMEGVPVRGCERRIHIDEVSRNHEHVAREVPQIGNGAKFFFDSLREWWKPWP